MTTTETRNPQPQDTPQRTATELLQMYSRTFTLLHQYDQGTLPNQAELEAELARLGEGEGREGSS